jgi:CHASE2 domain-containing sensor protein
MPGVEIHATIYEGIVADHLIRPLEAQWRMLFLLLFVLSAALLFPRAPPQLNWPLTLLILGGILGSSMLLLFFRQLWCAPGVSLLTIMLAYPIWSWRRFHSMTRFLDGEIQRLASEPGSRQTDSKRHTAAMGSTGRPVSATGPLGAGTLQ